MHGLLIPHEGLPRRACGSGNERHALSANVAQMHQTMPGIVRPVRLARSSEVLAVDMLVKDVRALQDVLRLVNLRR